MSDLYFIGATTYTAVRLHPVVSLPLQDQVLHCHGSSLKLRECDPSQGGPCTDAQSLWGGCQPVPLRCSSDASRMGHRGHRLGASAAAVLLAGGWQTLRILLANGLREAEIVLLVSSIMHKSL